MIFPHYNETKVVYHVVNINQLKIILDQGIEIEQRKDFSDAKYLNFNQFLDENRPLQIPEWVQREKALFASLNFKNNMHWHSHSALLAIRIQEERCWVANENIANKIYDPFILQDIKEFNHAQGFMEKFGEKEAKKYWENSFSFREYLQKSKDSMDNYDEEVMIFHEIPPADIKCLMVITDHNTFTPKRWQEYYKRSQC